MIKGDVADVIKNILQKNHAVYFENTDGVLFELTYNQNGAWRLRADKMGGESFARLGDAQDLARFMNEEVKDLKQSLTLTQDENVATVSCSDGYSVQLLCGDAFSVQFCGANGKRLAEVIGVEFDEKNAVVRGTLLDGEGVFGGGQRFDACNRRGTSMMLFSYDGYNTDHGKATYMPIPLFYTTGGGGMFFNHFERMNIDFGETESNTWKLDLCKNSLDVYFYTTGKYADLLNSYTELTGKPCVVPTEWMEGVLICRYAPDFEHLEPMQCIYNTFDEIPNKDVIYIDRTQTTLAKDLTEEERAQYWSFFGKNGLRCIARDKNGIYYRTTKKGGPSGAGIKYIVEQLIEAGQKPTAMVLEGFWYWKDCTMDNEVAKARRAEMKETVKWLNSLGIKVMYYMSVAEIQPSMKGYKPEYQLWVDLTYPDGHVESTYKIPQQGFTSNPDLGAGGATRSYLDITNPEAVEWYMNTVWEDRVEMGCDGMKIDFCEMMPEEGSYALRNKEKEVIGHVDLSYRFHNPEMFTGMNAHHALPTYYISLFCKMMNEKVAKRADGNGFMALSRGGGFGSQRNPYLWAGDQTRVFHNLKTQLTSTIASGLSGVPFMTYDMAGYGYSPEGYYFHEDALAVESQIYSRAVEYTAFTPCIQTHGDVRHLYQLTEETQKISHLYTELHTELMPYLQKVTKLACETGMPVVRHLVVDYQDDPNVYGIEDQFTLGDALLLAPILDDQVNAERTVYLPAGTWINLLTGDVVEGGTTVTVKANIAQIPAFLKKDAEDAQALAEIFAGENWKAIQAF